MPLYRYKCEKCELEFERIANPPPEAVCECKKCKGVAKKMINNSLAPTVMVKLDKYHNKSVMRNINKVMRNRSWNHQKNYEVDGLINKHGEKFVKRVTDFFDKETGKLKGDKK
jgi:putative FmdB family regulatory protein